jgi:hypothetical protein
MRDASDLALQRELAIAATLRQVGTSVGPTQSERDRMRRRVMAEFNSVVHEGNSPVLPMRVVSDRRRWIPDHTRGRLVVAAAAALCLLMSLSGMSLLLSRDAVPGDALYSAPPNPLNSDSPSVINRRHSSTSNSPAHGSTRSRSWRTKLIRPVTGRPGRPSSCGRWMTSTRMPPQGRAC